MENSNPEEFMPEEFIDDMDLEAIEEEAPLEEMLDHDDPEASPRSHGEVAYLVHVQTSARIDLPDNLQVIHIGKPNNLIPPDIDVSSYPDADIVSRVHGDVRIDDDGIFFEDTGSSNGTYVNNVPLPPGNRHRLRNGDRISLGKGDKVTFVFQTV